MAASRALLYLIATLLAALVSACQGGGGGGVAGNEGGSDPVNSQEALEYQKATVRCYKTGGTRVVKIMGQLRCY